MRGIGPSRDDEYETEHAGMPVDGLDQQRLPCLTERATFMSPLGYTVTRTHPYATSQALKGSLHPTTVSVPGYAFEAVPFRWMNRGLLTTEVGLDRVPAYDPTVEKAAGRALGYDHVPWIMDSTNQRAVLAEFFDPVAVGDSLVFVYLKHSPLQEQRTDRLLVGAARITGHTAPPMWNQTGTPPFQSSMWETIVEHSLRPDMTDGILLPYQRLIGLLDAGVEIDGALAWVPEGREVEFSYVTEHVSDDAAIEALASLRQAAEGMRALGVDVPVPATDWITAQTERLWQVRGPVPGMAAALSYLGVDRPHAAARAAVAEAGGADPWPLLTEALADGAVPAVRLAGGELAEHLARPVRLIWSRLSAEHRTVLRLLSALDVDAGCVRMLMNEGAEVDLPAQDLLDNPYLAVTCTYGMPGHVPFGTVDRALYPPTYVSWVPAVPAEVALDGSLDPRRIEALITDVVERMGMLGDTLVPRAEVIETVNRESLSRPVVLDGAKLTGLGLDPASILESSEWSPLTGVSLVGGVDAYKLTRFELTSRVVRDWIMAQRGRPRLGELPRSRAIVDAALDRDQDLVSSVGHDELEERAREEKAAGLSALHDGPVSVLIGPAGTGKTTLLKALVDAAGVADGGVLLLAPTGKAKVQLETKVGRPAKTLAGHLLKSGRYDGETGRYLVLDDERTRGHYGLVVIDEASMLTEEMLAATLDALAGVRRLVLVGDPRQLPPIGAGRPFVDLVNELRAADFDGWVRVAPGYVELQVPRRQMPGGTHGVRHDLELAAWFGDGPAGAAGDEIWAEIAADPDRETLRYEQWNGRPVAEVLTDALRDELALDQHDNPQWAFAMTYGATLKERYLNWEPGAGVRAEDWQILSPTRSRSFGTVELNRHIKRTYRADDTAYARRTTRSNIPRPIGPELIARGDKVMQTVNQRKTAYPTGSGIDYVANGEIGVGIGRITSARTRKKASLYLNVEFSSQPGAQYGYRPSTSDDPPLELAWAVTVHKSQGSEFGITFLVLPARTAVSRELMYTALTRQREKIVILHDGDLTGLRELAEPGRSETARRLTDLFCAPDPVTLKRNGIPRRYDRTLLHVAENGVAMASKNEVIIAGILDRLVPGRWQYENPYTGADGREVLPDFTIATDTGRTVYWEHAGMLDRPDYARKWDLKKQWYTDNGILEHSVGGGPNGVLMWTDDRKGVDAPAWRALAAEVLGVPDTGGESAGRPIPRPRRSRTKLPPASG